MDWRIQLEEQFECEAEDLRMEQYQKDEDLIANKEQ